MSAFFVCIVKSFVPVCVRVTVAFSCLRVSNNPSGRPTVNPRPMTVTLTHTGTKDLTMHTKNADIIVAAIGQAHFLKASMIKPGAVVIDVGISRTDKGLLGDVDPSVMDVASWVAPMPGGVGPMTRAMLVKNVVDACG